MRPFQFSPDDLKRYEAQAEEVQLDIAYYRSEKLKELGARIRLHVVKPFCRKFNLTYDTGMGSWSFRYVRNGKQKTWFVGEDRRELPNRPDTEDGDEWFVDITEEEKLIRALLNQSSGLACIGTWVNDYPDKHGE